MVNSGKELSIDDIKFATSVITKKDQLIFDLKVLLNLANENEMPSHFQVAKYKDCDLWTIAYVSFSENGMEAQVVDDYKNVDSQTALNFLNSLDIEDTIVY